MKRPVCCMGRCKFGFLAVRVSKFLTMRISKVQRQRDAVAEEALSRQSHIGGCSEDSEEADGLIRQSSNLAAIRQDSFSREVSRSNLFDPT
eukprot:3643554-Pleurochrysis_carterae.AAC.9